MSKATREDSATVSIFLSLFNSRSEKYKGKNLYTTVSIGVHLVVASQIQDSPQASLLNKNNAVENPKNKKKMFDKISH